LARDFFSNALRINPDSKPKLYGQIYESAEISEPSYLLDLVFAAGIATLGLELKSPAVVIGAMLISPLMGPILAAGPFDAPTQEAVRNALRRALNTEKLNTVFDWQAPRKVRAAVKQANAK